MGGLTGAGLGSVTGGFIIHAALGGRGPGWHLLACGMVGGTASVLMDPLPLLDSSRRVGVPTGSDRGRRSALASALVGAAATATLLVAASALQKWLIGAPMGPRGFIVPLVFGALVGLLLGIYVGRERTQRRRHQAAERALAAAQDAMPLGLAILDEHQVVQRANRWLVEELGFDPSGQRCCGVLPGCEDQDESCLIQEAIRSGRATRLEGRRAWRERQVEVSVQPVDEHRVLLVILDRTRRQELECQREILEARLERARRMEALGRLAGGVAHDLNNMLQAILANLAELEGRVSEEELGGLEESVEQTAALVKRLQALARGEEAPQLQELDLVEVVRRATRLATPLLPEGVALRVDEGSSAVVLADSDQLAQVLHNLILNAHQAMPLGGRITLRTGADHSMGWVEVVDQGVGMPPEVVEHVFEPFFTRRQGGTGLGLAMAWTSIRAQQGHIQVQSTPGLGSSFRVHLPLAHPVRPPSLSPTARRTVLVVERDEAVRKLVHWALESRGLEVLEASEPQQALERASRGLDLVILDLDQPGGQGPRLFQALRDAQPGLAVLFTSAGVGPGADDLPGTALLHKPYGIESLRDTVSRLLVEQGRL